MRPLSALGLLLALAACGGPARGDRNADPEDPGAPEAPPVTVENPPTTTNAEAKLFLDGFFPIAADFQPPENFAAWKARGVNTMIRVPHSGNVGDWTAAANAAGLKMIREPRADPSRDVGEANLLAWQWMDEPDIHRASAADLASFRAKLQAIDPSRPIFTNFWGGAVLSATDGYCNGPGDGTDEACYPGFIANTDWVSEDIYPCNKYGCDISVVGKAVSRLEGWAGQRPAFAYIETSDFDGNGTAPSARRLNSEVWEAVIHGARGVFYFAVKLQSPCASGPDGCIASYDATPAALATQLAKTNALLAALAPVLQAPVNPAPVTVGVPAGLEAGWRRDREALYVIASNPTSTDRTAQRVVLGAVTATEPAEAVGEGRTVAVDASGALVDDFAAYAVHVYRVK